METVQKGGFTQNQLKLLAAAAMLIDHVGAELFPQTVLLRIIGRLSFPLFSYFIYEGFQYTHSKKNYFCKIFLLGVVCVAVYYFYSGEIYGNVLITFSASIALLYGISVCRQRMDGTAADRFCGLAFLAGCALCVGLACQWIYVDYGLFGVLLPVFAELAKGQGPDAKALTPLAGFTMGLVFLSVQMGGIQYFSLGAVPLLMLYNGRRGTVNLKSFFYWFYPVHLAVVGLLAQLIR